jgi:hypothetical protein
VKPRIRRLVHGPVLLWECSCKRAVGYGYTVAEAYRNWYRPSAILRG